MRARQRSVLPVRPMSSRLERRASRRRAAWAQTEKSVEGLARTSSPRRRWKRRRARSISCSVKAVSIARASLRGLLCGELRPERFDGAVAENQVERRGIDGCYSWPAGELVRDQADRCRTSRWGSDCGSGAKWASKVPVQANSRPRAGRQAGGQRGLAAAIVGQSQQPDRCAGRRRSSRSAPVASHDRGRRLQQGHRLAAQHG